MLNDQIHHSVDTLIVGAGLSGLSAANDLQQAGHNVLLVDKGRGLGGRLAGRRIGDASFDHGAQFMTTRDQRFAATVQGWIADGVAEEWYSSFPGSSGESHPRYRGVPTMTAIAKHMATDLNILRSVRVLEIAQSDNQWLVSLDNGEQVTAKSMLITAPVPQTIDLLAAGNIQLSDANQARLELIEYETCIAVMAVLDGPSTIPAPGAMAVHNSPVAWLSDNQQKGVSTIPAVTIHGSGDFSTEYFELDRQAAGQQLINAAQPLLGAAVKEFQVHGWRYSKPSVVDSEPCMLASTDTQLPPLALAGDAFNGPRVEGAVVSGWAAAAVLTGLL
jgi:predicted NAD/FAD-dependent oxidoreductase